MIWTYGGTGKISAQKDQGFKHLLCKLEIQTEFANGRCAQTLNYGTWVLNGNGEYMDIRSSTNYLGFFLATKMAAPLESAQIAILALNRKRQFPYLMMANIFMGAQYDHKEYLHKFS